MDGYYKKKGTLFSDKEVLPILHHKQLMPQAPVGAGLYFLIGLDARLCYNRALTKGLKGIKRVWGMSLE